MVWDLNFGIEIVGAPIVRETDGLAMSSRNAYLSEAEREAARCVPAAIQAARACVEAGERDRTPILDAVRQVIAAQPVAELSYADIADIDTLERVHVIEQSAQLLLAVFIGKTRLIDNCRLVPQTSVASANTEMHGSERG